MLLYLILSRINYIFLAISLCFLIFVLIRFLKPNKINISYKKIVWVAVVLKIFFVSFLTWGQYYVWVKGGSLTKVLVELPMPKDISLPFAYRWLRPIFEMSHGYFVQYVWTHFWLSTVIAFLVSFALYFIFKIWKKYRGNFIQEGPTLLLILMIICGWPGIVLFIPLGFVLAVFGFIIGTFRGKSTIYVERFFLISAFIVTILVAVFPYLLSKI